jgi:hypothetical protein
MIKSADKEITSISKRIDELTIKNNAALDSINVIKNNNISIEKEVGGFRFVAESFGVPLNSVVKFFIILIVIVFDPLAVALIISFNQLTMDGKKEDEDEDKKEPSSPEDLKNFVDETTRIRLSEDELKKLEEVLLNPPPPNEELKKAAYEYERRGELLAEIMKNDEELGLYNEPFDNPLIKVEEIHQINEDSGKNSSNKEESEVIVENKSLTAKLGELKKNGYKVSQLEEEEITTENTIEPTSPEKDDEKKK